MAANNDAEAHFLESRKARARENKKTRKTDVLNAFWVALKSRWRQWNEDLQAVESSYEECPPPTEQGKRKLRLDLCRLELELKELRNACLADGYAIHADANEDGSCFSHVGNDWELTCPPDLPLSDLKLLHTRFSQCQNSLDQVRKTLLPQGKFIFRRYREEMLRLQQTHSQQPSVEKSRDDGTQQKRRRSLLDPYRTVSNLSNQNLVIHADGKVDVECRGDATPQHHSQLASQCSTLVLRMLDNCEIEL